MEDTSQNAGSTGTSDAGSTAAPASGAVSKPTSASSAMESAAARSAATVVPASTTKPGGQAGGDRQPAQPAAAVAQPAKPVTAQPGAKGPIPFDAHETALKNARDKSRQETMQKFAWANDIDPAVAQRALAIAKRLDSDPRSFAKQLAAELAEGGDEDFKLPAADIRTKDGVEAYSAKAMSQIADAIRKDVIAQMQGQLKPIMDERQEAQEKAEKQKTISAAVDAGRQTVREGITHARTLPHFVENEKAISAKLGEISPETRSKVGLVGALYMAYAAVLAEQVGLARAAGGEETLTDLRRKAQAGSGGVTPGGPVVGQKTVRPKNQDELAAHMGRLAANMASA